MSQPFNSGELRKLATDHRYSTVQVARGELLALLDAYDAAYAAGLERAAKECERTYAKSAFHYELGTGCAAAIRYLKTQEPNP